MIAHCEAPNRTKAIRREGVIDRQEYEQRVFEFAKRGKDLPHTKLNQKQVREIRDAAIKREAMRKEITDTMSNQALAKKYGVHYRTIEKVVQYVTHISI